MDQDAETMLARLTPRGAPPELRKRVLRAIQRDLSGSGATQLRTRLAWAVAAAIAVAVGLNYWAVRADQLRQAHAYGPSPVPRAVAEIVQEVEAVSGPEAARLVQKQLHGAGSSRDVAAQQIAAHYRRLLQQAQLAIGVFSDAEAEKDSRLDRDRPRRASGGTSYRQRHLDLVDRLTA